jgi:squalene-hopene/tetraprenyl-beta-curcumene cyclase
MTGSTQKRILLGTAAMILVAASPARTVGSKPINAGAPAWRVAAERGLTFLTTDAEKWRKERQCSTCHHGVMTVWAMTEAKSSGYAVEPETMAQIVGWTKEKLANIDKPRDTRMGWNMVNTPALYLAMMAQSVPKQDTVSPNELKQIAGHLVRHQEETGNWAWSLAPAQNRPPPIFESDEVATRLASMALDPYGGKKAKKYAQVEGARESLDKAISWLGSTPRDEESTQACAFRLLAKVRQGKRVRDCKTEVKELLGRQRPDGGWGQLRGSPSDAYATGQAVYVLHLVGLGKTIEANQGAAFLASTQMDDGSWEIKPRAQPGANPSKSPVPIVHAGSAWATMALMRSAAAR